MRPHGINQYSFLVYLSGLRSKVTVTFWTSLSLASLSAYCALIPASCSSGYDFAIPSSRLHLTVQTLGVAFGLVGNYLPYGLSPQDIDMPVVLKKFAPAGVRTLNSSLFLYIFKHCFDYRVYKLLVLIGKFSYFVKNKRASDFVSAVKNIA